LLDDAFCVGRLVFKEGVLVTALRRGHWVVLDELNLAPSEVLEALNRCGFGTCASGTCPLSSIKYC
jgi:midasin (ATPase involved in ribosome maturation)